ncbi:hypothetical protein J3459_018098 [Metarhizium acridum]|uniref:Uncharacterized protein n=1 Tax=Metarhizium acridum (strain CQMa 102) TaxID=655827 RepID=E9DQX6_METAQ|nr:uncharacterized protein MAC_00145 [Metarhizium acridum CQMa 102]EFY93654.1 hypothetical protein MAC_00145 [Metarhizium acridum CQMa 102]KAG8408237.1 hypothetical protein J3459_018098 [Metarhizium acridum]KAG8410262.1 hypothetical protein J3458_017977 [Metarhizium acridum]
MLREYSKATLYTTQFMLGYLTVVVYAFFRIDQIYQLTTFPMGQVDQETTLGMEAPSVGYGQWPPEDIERENGKLGVRYDILTSRGMNKKGPVFALLYPASSDQPFAYGDKELSQVPPEYEDGSLLPRPRRVSRMDNFTGSAYPERPPRSERTTMFMA